MSNSSSPLRLLPIVIVVIALVGAFKLTSILLLGAPGSPAIGTALAQDENELLDADPDAVVEEVLDPEATGQFQTSETAPEAEPSDEFFMAPGEQDVLESLQRRRLELEERAEELELRERLLQAAEQRVEERIAELREIEERIDAAFGQQAEDRRAQMENLVGLYENMKPKEAAKIFDRLDMDVLIGVVEQMQMRRMSPILARMDPAVAERLTVELAARAEERAGSTSLSELETE